MNIGVHIFSNYSSMPRSGTAGSNGNSIFRFLRNLPNVLHSGCTSLHPHQQCRQAPFYVYPLQHWLFAGFSMMPFWYFIVGLSYISLLTSNVRHLFMCLLLICMSSLEKCLFKSSAHFLLGLLVFLYWIVWAVCINWKSVTCQSHRLQIFFSKPVGCLFTLFMVSFARQKSFWVIS